MKELTKLKGNDRRRQESETHLDPLEELMKASGVSVYPRVCCGKTPRKNEAGDFMCQSCGKVAQSFRIYIRQLKQTVWLDHNRSSLTSHKQASKVALLISKEIADGTFNISNYRKPSKETQGKLDFRFGAWKDAVIEEYQRRMNELDPLEDTDEEGWVSPGWFKNVKGYIANYIVPYFGEMDSRKIIGAHIVGFFNQEYIKSKSRSSRNSIRSVLIAYFKLLMKWQIISRMPELPRTLKRKKRRRPIADVQLQDYILDYYRDNLHAVDYAFLMAGVEAGDRPGAMMVIQRQDIDWSRNTILIRRSYSGASGIKVIKEGTKTGKDREILMSEDLQRAIRGIWKDIGRPEDFIFSFDGGRSPYPQNRWQKVFRRVRRKLELPEDLDFYGVTRHSWTTQNLEAGVHPARLQEARGDVDIRTTMTYYHGNPEMLRDCYNVRSILKKKAEVVEFDKKQKKE